MFKNISKLINSHPVGQLFNLAGQDVAWKKVRELKPGMKIAIAPSGEILNSKSETLNKSKLPKFKIQNSLEHLNFEFRNCLGFRNSNLEFDTEGVAWDEIVSIKKVGRQRVWDIEVEATHNFVAGHLIEYLDERTWNLELGTWQVILDKNGRGKSKLRKVGDLAGGDKIGRADLSVDQGVPQRGEILSGRSSSKSSRVCTCEYSRGSGQKQQEGIQAVSVDSQRVFAGIRYIDDRCPQHGLYKPGGAARYSQTSDGTYQENPSSKLQAPSSRRIEFGGIVAHNTASILMRAGNASVAGSGLGTAADTADIQLAAADSFVLNAGDLTINASEDSTYPIILRSAQGGIQLSTQSSDNGNLTLYSAGTLTLDSSRNNTNIILSPGTGNVGIGTTAPNDKLSVTGTVFLGGTSTGLNINAGAITSAYAPNQAGDSEIPITINAIGINTTSLNLQTGGTNRISIAADGNVGIGSASAKAGILDVLGAGAGVLLRAGSASLQLSSSATSTTADIELAAADQMDLFAGRFSLTTSSSVAGDLKLISTGTLSLSTSSNNTGINVMTGTGALTETIGSLSTTASASSLNAILLRASSGGIQLSTGSVGLGSLRLLSSGSLTLETSQNNTNIALLPGSGGVALGISTPAGSATLDISSTSKGFLPPRMTTTQRDAIGSPTKGLTIFNDTTNQLNVYNGSAWTAVNPGSSCNNTGDCRLTLSAEYPGAVISADGSNNVGTITSDLTLSASNYYYNYYEFSSGQASQQDYDVYIRWQLPLGWADWDDAANAIEIDLATESSTSTDSKVDATIYRENDADSYSETANVSPTGGEWRTVQESKSVLSITKTNLNTVQNPWVAGDVLVIKLKLYSKDNYYSRIGNIRITYENQ